MVDMDREAAGLQRLDEYSRLGEVLHAAGARGRPGDDHLYGIVLSKMRRHAQR
jgi:hypothetical protein